MTWQWTPSARVAGKRFTGKETEAVEIIKDSTICYTVSHLLQWAPM
jgi:hypothetical protein